MTVQVRIISRMPSVLDRPRRWHSARNACHSSISIRPVLRLGVSCPSVQQGPQLLALGGFMFENVHGDPQQPPAPRHG
jgi:hypothetical protein